MPFPKTLICFFLFLFPFTLFSQIVGIWEGKLPVGTDSLRLLLAVEQHGDSLWAEMDSPDQYVAGIEVNSISFQHDTLRLKAKSVGATFQGVYNAGNEKIVGVFKQGGGKLPLTLYRVAERWKLNRPQTPKEPFPYEEEDVKLQFPHATLGQIPITGTLSYPSRKHEFNNILLILVSGSGWQDRDESIMGHKPFAVGDKLDMLDTVNIGDTVKVSFSIESREFNGKWYTDVKAWKIEPATEAPAQPAAAPAYQPAAGPAPSADTLPPMASDDLDTFTDNGGDDLPF